MVIIPSMAETRPLLCSLENNVMRYSTALATPKPSAYSDMPATTLVTLGQYQVTSTIRLVTMMKPNMVAAPTSSRFLAKRE